MSNSRYIVASILCGIILVSCGAQNQTTIPETPTLASTISPTNTQAVVEVQPTNTQIVENKQPTNTPPPTLVGPSPRTQSNMLYDPVAGRLMMIGGYSCANTWSSNDMDLKDIWAFNFEDESWEDIGELDILNPYNMGYDAESERVIFLTNRPIETWSYHPATGEIIKMLPKGEEQPPDSIISLYMWGARMVYDSESDRLILFGGAERPSLIYNQTWAYDYNSNTWSNMQPDNPPPERAFHEIAYDTESDRVIVWGGFQNGGDDNQVWAYDYNSNTWEELENINGPTMHYERFGMVYHPPSDRMIIYSGFQEGNEVSEEVVFSPATWYYDYNTNTWEEISTENNPGTRFMYSMAYDESADKVVLFSGEQTSKYANDLTTAVWVFDPVKQEWTDVSKEYIGCP